MLACWVALEDINYDKGPLHYIPRSHLLPSFTKYECPRRHTHLNSDRRFFRHMKKIFRK